MKKHPLKVLGIAFTAVAAVEWTVLLVILLLCPKHTLGTLVVLPGVLGLQGLIFGGLGIGFLMHVRKKEKIREDLLSSGYVKQGYVVDTERVSTVRLNGRYPFRVIVRVEENGVLHEYRSDMLQTAPGIRPGDPIKVYVDWQDDSRYYVDVENAAPPIIRH